MYQKQVKRFKSDTIIAMKKSFMGNLIPQCLVCDRDEQQVPLIRLQYRGNGYWICPQHFPILIHNPDQLIGKLPGAENLAGHDHGEE